MNKIFISLCALLPTLSWADALKLEDFKFPVSGSYALGSLKNDSVNLKSRTMQIVSLEALPSYKYGDWLLGVHLDYRWQEQLTSLKKAGGTNLQGRGYLLGLGARRNFDRAFVQGSFDFFGYYDLTKNTSSSQDDNLHSPLSFRVKSGYALFKNIPELTFDVDVQYLKFNQIKIAGSSSAKSSEQLSFGVGLTYIFGK